MDLLQWTVGGRGFGLVLIWLLMAGEVYTTFTFLGTSGWAYSKGAPVLYAEHPKSHRSESSEHAGGRALPADTNEETSGKTA